MSRLRLHLHSNTQRRTHARTHAHRHTLNVPLPVPRWSVPAPDVQRRPLLTPPAPLPLPHAPPLVQSSSVEGADGYRGEPEEWADAASPTQKLSEISQIGPFAEGKKWLAKQLAGDYDAQVCAGQSKAVKGRAGQGRAGQGRAGQTGPAARAGVAAHQEWGWTEPVGTVDCHPKRKEGVVLTPLQEPSKGYSRDIQESLQSHPKGHASASLNKLSPQNPHYQQTPTSGRHGLGFAA